MNVKFYQFQKRENSTAQPGVGVTATTYVCKLKDNCSIINPIIQIAKESAQAWSLLIGFNYAYIPDFNRYYFVRDIVMESNVICSISLEVDALASWKSQIGSASEYVLRSASSYDGDIVDNLYPTKGNTTLYLSDFSPSSSKFNTSDITYIIGILNNNDSPKFGAVQYYVLTETQLGNLMKFLLGTNPGGNDDFWEDMYLTFSAYTLFTQETQDQILNSVINPLQYIVESYALPYKPYDPNSVPADQQIKVGPIDLGPSRKGKPLPASSTLHNFAR